MPRKSLDALGAPQPERVGAGRRAKTATLPPEPHGGEWPPAGPPEASCKHDQGDSRLTASTNDNLNRCMARSMAPPPCSFRVSYHFGPVASSSTPPPPMDTFSRTVALSCTVIARNESSSAGGKDRRARLMTATRGTGRGGRAVQALFKGRRYAPGVGFAISNTHGLGTLSRLCDVAPGSGLANAHLCSNGPHAQTLRLEGQSLRLLAAELQRARARRSR